MARTVKVGLDVDERPFVRGMGKAKDAVGAAGDKAKATARDFDRLGDEIRDTQRRVRDLAAEIRRVGPNEDLLKKFGAEEASLAKLARVKKSLDSINDSVRTSSRIGFGSGGLFASFSVSRVLGAVGPGGAIAGGTVAAGIGTMVGAGIVGAIGGAAGTAAIAAGIAAASDDPKVQAAWGALVGDLKILESDLADAFAEPTAAGIHVLRRSLAAVRDDVDEIGRISARWVGPLSEGLGGFLERAVEGLRNLLARMDPVFEMLRHELPELGGDVKQFFTDIGAGAQGGAEALGLILDLTGAAIVGTGKILSALGQAYDLAEDLSRIVTKPGFGALAVFDENRPRKYAKALHDVTKAAGFTEKQIQELSDAFDEWLDKGLDAEEAADRFRLGLLELDDAIAENGRSLSDASEGGLKNQQVIRDLIKLAGEQRRAEIERADATVESIAQANAAYDTNIAKVIDIGVKAGLSRAELTKMAGSYGVNVYLTGLDRIRDQFRALAAAASVVPGLGGAAIGFNLAQGIIGAAIPKAKGDIVAAQEGMIATSPTVLFGERQTVREAFIPQEGISRQRGMALGAEAMRWHGASVVPWEQMRGGGGPSHLTLHATFVLPDGSTSHKQLIEYALSRGQTPAQLWPAAR